jgi:hypothetical protein
VDYRASQEWDFLYNALVGDGIGFNDDSQGKLYTYHNFVAKYFGAKIDFALGIDIATQAKTKVVTNGEPGSALYFSSIAEARFKVSKQFNVMGRGEFFQDSNGISVQSRPITTDCPLVLKPLALLAEWNSSRWRTPSFAAKSVSLASTKTKKCLHQKTISSIRELKSFSRQGFRSDCLF